LTSIYLAFWKPGFRLPKDLIIAYKGVIVIDFCCVFKSMQCDS